MTFNERVLAVLSYEPQTIPHIASWMGVSTRKVEQALEELAVSGRCPLVADGRGVRLTNDPAELYDYQQSLRRRAMAVLRRYRGIGIARERLAKPLTLFEDVA